MARVIESFFLMIGLILVDYYVWQKASAGVYQGYESWAFDRELSGQTASIRDFLAAELRIAPRGTPINADGRATDENPSIIQQPSAPVARQLAGNALIGRLNIPSVGIAGIVREGTDASTLERAVGHVPSTPLPWQDGNVAVAAHRDSFFRGLSRIRQNDLITFDTLRGRYQYQVQSMKIVSPKDVSVLRSGSDPELTLITCYPFYYVGSAPKRFVVQARRVEVTADNRNAAEQASLHVGRRRTARKPAI